VPRNPLSDLLPFGRTSPAEDEPSGTTGTTGTLQWTYAELVRIETHWTGQIQDQQRRIAAVLAVNGFLLAFLAAGGLSFYGSRQTGWVRIPLGICLALLAFGLTFGVLALVPKIAVAGGRSRPGADAEGPEDDWNAISDLVTLEPTAPPPRMTRLQRFKKAFFTDRDDRINEGATVQDAWLDSRVVWYGVRGCLPDFSALADLDKVLFQLCESVARNADWNREHKKTNARRRVMMNRDIAFVILALVALIVAIFGRLFS
jgi:hypothetical protein